MPKFITQKDRFKDELLASATPGYLNFANRDLSDKDLEDLDKLPVITLVLSGNPKITDTGLKKLLTLIPGLRTLSLFRMPQISPRCLAELGRTKLIIRR